MLLGDRRDDVLPEAHRLGVGVVDAEDRHAGVDPQFENTLDFLLDAGHVGVEVDRVDVLILLRRVLREGDGAVRLVAEPIRVLLDPRVVGRALQREVERDFQTQLVGLGDERLEIVHVAEQRVDGVMPTQLGTDAERRARIVGTGLQRVVASLAVRLADREDRRQVHDVEAFGLGAFQAGHRRLERALDDLAGLRVDVGALGTREELVPCGEAGFRTLHEETLGLAGRDAVAQRVGQMQLGDRFAGRRGETVLGRKRCVLHGGGSGDERLALRGAQLGVGGLRPAFQQLRAGFEGVLDVVVDLDFDGRVMQPGLVGVLPPFDGDAPFAQLALDGGEFGLPRLDVAVLAAGEHDLPAVEAGVGAGHRQTLHLLAAVVAHNGGGTDFGAAFDEDLRGDLERFAQLDTGGETAGFLVRRHVHDGDASELRRVYDGNGLCGDLTVGDGGRSGGFCRSGGARRLGRRALARRGGT